MRPALQMAGLREFLKACCLERVSSLQFRESESVKSLLGTLNWGGGVSRQSKELEFSGRSSKEDRATQKYMHKYSLEYSDEY